MAAFYILAGANHFIDPGFYQQMMPPFLPMHYFLIYFSGVIEIVLGLGLFFKKTRKLSAYGIILLLIAIFPANIYMAINNVQLEGLPTPAWVTYARLPFQFFFIAWAYWHTSDERSN